MLTKSASEAVALSTEILVRAGATRENAETVATHLVSANLSGVDTHGIWHLGGYVKGVQAGDIVPDASPQVLRESPTSALVSGNWTFGQVAAKYAMKVAIEKARAQNISIVSMIQAHHIGRLGYYVEMAAAQGMVAMLWAGGYSEVEPAAAPYGGRTRVLHTNPISVGLPMEENHPMMFDFATTAASGVKIVNARARNEQVPPGYIVDKDGNPTTDPNDFFAGGAHVPFGAHKGYGLMMAAEFLGRIFSGADAYADAARGGPIMRHQGVTMIVFRDDLFQPTEQYLKTAQEMEARIHAVPPAAGFNQVLVPGDLEARTREKREHDGMPMEDDVWKALVELRDSLPQK